MNARESMLCATVWSGSQGDQTASQELLVAVCDRLQTLAHVMLRDYPRVTLGGNRRRSQNALIRLHRALQTVMPPSLRDFFRLATLQIRRELVDLVRHYYGPEGSGPIRRAWSAFGPVPGERHGRRGSLEPSRLALWSEFHQQVEKLPEEEREVFDLIWYQGLGHTEAGELLAVCPRTVKRRWQSACLKLHDALPDGLPGYELSVLCGAKNVAARFLTCRFHRHVRKRAATFF